MKSFVTTIVFVLIIGVIYTAGAQMVTVSEVDCRNLVQHSPSADVAYKPGVDAYGRSVVSADLGGGTPIQIPKFFSIPITVDLQKRLGLPADSSSYQTQNFSVGSVEWIDGKAWFNGQPLQNPETAKLTELCRKRLASGR
jgi:hypothetical protein